jgi:hypothetical protein
MELCAGVYDKYCNVLECGSVVLKVGVAGREHAVTNVRHLVSGKTQPSLGALCQCSEHSKIGSSLVKLGELHVDGKLNLVGLSHKLPRIDGLELG